MDNRKDAQKYDVFDEKYCARKRKVRNSQKRAVCTYELYPLKKEGGLNETENDNENRDRHRYDSRAAAAYDL